MSLQDPDLKRQPTKGDTRVLVLPSGGTVEIPMPGNAKQRGVVIKPPSHLLRGALEGGSVVVPVIVGIVIGGVIVGGVWWALSRR